MIEIHVPEFPACAEPCKACDTGDGRRTVWVVEVCAFPGDEVAEHQLLAVVETNKTTVEVTAPQMGVVEAVHVQVGDETVEGAPLVDLRPRPA